VRQKECGGINEMRQGRVMKYHENAQEERNERGKNLD
jgi:hypothetical protein